MRAQPGEKGFQRMQCFFHLCAVRGKGEFPNSSLQEIHLVGKCYLFVLGGIKED